MAHRLWGAHAMLQVFRGWTPTQWHVVAASYLGWTLDAFDYFILVFVLRDVAGTFTVSITAVSLAIWLTLAMRPLGAFIFGRLADRFGRRPVLMLDVGLYSLFGFATAFAPSLAVFLVIRALFGVAMGGEWGVGASLTMESIQPKARGVVSGMLQSGYPSGYLLASLVYAVLYPMIGWRGMFMVGIVPSLLILYIRSKVPESPAFNREKAVRVDMADLFRRHWQLAVYAVLLMTAFNFFSHGTQDLYPTFLQKQRHYDHNTVGAITIAYNIAAILGGIVFGSISQMLGRRRAIMMSAICVIPAVWLGTFAPNVLALAAGAFIVQFFVQGAWGVIPAHLNELSPPEARGAFPGTVYQLGNFIAASNATLQAYAAEHTGGDYALPIACVAIGAALAITLLVWRGREAKDVDMLTSR
jgi:MFS transporter, SHS family, lactate transporter